MIIKRSESPELSNQEKVIVGIWEVLALDYLMEQPYHDPDSFFSLRHALGIVARHYDLSLEEVYAQDIIARSEMTYARHFMQEHLPGPE